MSVCAFNYFPKCKYSNLFIEAAFSSKSFLVKHLLTFPDHTAGILALCLSKSY